MKIDYNKIKNLKVRDYASAVEILKEHNNVCDENEDDEKVAIFVVGPNGSGKSTMIADLYAKNIINYAYINADMIALVNNKNDYSAMADTMTLLQSYLSEGKSFVYETVFSYVGKMELVMQAKILGYSVITIFVYTNDYNTNIKRVAKRVSQGGHNVPTEKIILRYKRCFENVQELKRNSDEFYEFDNSFDIDY